MAQPQPTSAEWMHALRECAASRSLHVLHEHVLLVYVDPRETFHPLHALLLPPRGACDRESTRRNDDDGDDDDETNAFIAIMQLHNNVVTLLRELQRATTPHNESDTMRMCRKVLESLVFVDHVVDVTSAKRAHDVNSGGGSVALAVPFFCTQEVNLRGGALCALVADEASARAVLADITVAVQASESLDCLDDDDGTDSLTVVVEHDGGYIAQRFAHRVVASVTRVSRRAFEPPDATLDSVLERYEHDFVEQLELAGVELDASQQQLAVRVHAGFRVATSVAQSRSPSRLSATLLSSWSGIENIRSLGSKPPPNSASFVCIGEIDGGREDAHCRSSLLSSPSSAAAIAATAAPFPARVEQTIALLTKLEQSAQDSTFKWRSGPDALDNPQDTAHNHVVSALQRFLRDPDTTTSVATTSDVSVDANTTLELNVALRAAHDDELDVAPSRTDRDFLERLWSFALENVSTAASAAALVHELVAVFAAARTLPLVHAHNPTQLAAFLTHRPESNRTDSAAPLIESDLSSARGALLALAELGEWTLQRDIAAWLTHIGFTVAESACVVGQLAKRTSAGSDTDAIESHMQRHVAMQQLVAVCALAHSLGMASPLLRKLASDCLGSSAVHKQSGLAASHAPVFVVPLNAFIPERIRMNLTDALFWDLEISLGELMQRKVRVCEASFHATCAASQGLQDNDNGGDERKFAPTAPALDSRTITQLQQQLVSETPLLPAARMFIQQIQPNQSSLATSAAGLVIVECTTRRLVA